VRSRSDDIALWALVISNMAILVMAVFYQWSYYAPLLLFWCETIIIGLYNVVKMFVVAITGDPFGRWAEFGNAFSAIVFTTIIILFFIVKFGGIVVGAGIFALMVPALLEPDGGAAAAIDALRDSGDTIVYGVAVLAISHGISLVRNFIMRREYRKTNLLGLLFLPYLRSVWLGVTILAGLLAGHLVPGAGRTIVFVIVIVLIKSAGDLASHVLEHRWFGRRVAR
jgi:hypothetical protein